MKSLAGPVKTKKDEGGLARISVRIEPTSDQDDGIREIHAILYEHSGILICQSKKGSYLLLHGSDPAEECASPQEIAGRLWLGVARTWVPPRSALSTTWAGSCCQSARAKAQVTGWPPARPEPPRAMMG